MHPPAPGLAELLPRLRAHPKVADLAVMDAGVDRPPFILVLPDRAWLGDALREQAAAASEDVLRGWEALYDLSYDRSATQEGPNFDVWTDSFSRKPIPIAEMQAWLAETADRILSLPHEDVMEIGCGTGLILQAVAAHCRSYRASDLSQVAVSRLSGWVATQPGLSHTALRHAPAHLATGPAGSDAEQVDLVILNSVIQYFPDGAYLTRVLQAAWDVLRPGGHLFIGDVRWKNLLPVFVTAIERARAPEGMTAGALREAIARRLAAQSELVVDPDFFEAFAHARGGAVACWLKPGQSQVEMTRFRYDAVLQKPPAPATVKAPPPLAVDRASFHAMLKAEPRRGAALLMPGNARVAADCAWHAALMAAGPEADLASLAAVAGVVPLGDPAAIAAEVQAMAGLDCVIEARASETGGFLIRAGKDLARLRVPQAQLPLPLHLNSPAEIMLLKDLSFDLLDAAEEAVADWPEPPSIIPLCEEDYLRLTGRGL
ncbi:hypothetical protein AcidC75_05170 [Acidisoma sp. C75]